MMVAITAANSRSKVVAAKIIAVSGFALLLAVLIRNQLGAIVSIFAAPVVEHLLSLIIKQNSVYLPFTALDAVLTHSRPAEGFITYTHAALVVMVYLVVGWLVAWLLFVRRDAS